MSCFALSLTHPYRATKQFLRSMATCLMACFGQVRQDGIKVFSKLGGQYLGNIDVDKTSMNALQQVRFLQLQASRLCPHPTRSCKDLLLYVDQQKVGPPGMPYITEFSPEERLDVEQALSIMKTITTLKVMWDESDEHAIRVIQATTLVHTYSTAPQQAVLGLFAPVPNEITFLARSLAKQGITNLKVGRWSGSPCVQDLRFLHNLNLKGLVLFNIKPTNWADCNVKALCIESKQLDFAFNTFDGLDKVEELSLLDLDFSGYNTPVKHYTFGALRGCSNLKKLRIEGYLTPEATKQLVETLTGMPNVKTLSFAGHAPLSLVQDLQAIPSLSLVQVTLYGDDLGCVWTILCCLPICLFWVLLGFRLTQLLKA
jgi:hypothetical protein